MTNYNERLDELLEDLTEDIADQFGGDTTEHPQPHLKKQAKQAITSLIKALVAEATPEPGTNLTSYEAQMFIISTEEYRQNLLKALEAEL